VLHSFRVSVVAVRVNFTEEKGWHGGTDVMPGSTDHLPYMDQAANWAAGRAAEEVFTCPAHRLAWLDDLGQIDALLKANEIPEDERWPQIEEAITRARTILEPHRDKALKLIDLLVEHSRVDGPEFARLMDGGPN